MSNSSKFEKPSTPDDRVIFPGSVEQPRRLEAHLHLGANGEFHA